MTQDPFISSMSQLSLMFAHTRLCRYRYYKGTPLFPFGFGLSYTTFLFAFVNASVAEQGGRCVDRGGDPTHGGQGCAAREFSVRVSNIGHRRGAEVVQLYMVPPSAVQWDAPVPSKQLLAFRKVALDPAESTVVTFVVEPGQLQLVNAAGVRRVPGAEFTLLFTNGAGVNVTAPFIRV